MDIDCLVMLSILKLHRGKSVKCENGRLFDVIGTNDTSINNVHSCLSSADNPNIDINVIKESINRLQEKGYLYTDNDLLCPSISLVHYFVEILQYEENKEESLRMLSSKISMLESQK